MALLQYLTASLQFETSEARKLTRYRKWRIVFYLQTFRKEMKRCDEQHDIEILKILKRMTCRFHKILYPKTMFSLHRHLSKFIASISIERLRYHIRWYITISSALPTYWIHMYLFCISWCNKMFDDDEMLLIYNNCKNKIRKYSKIRRFLMRYNLRSKKVILWKILNDINTLAMDASKIIKYSILSRIVCKSKIGYICHFLYCGRSISLEKIIMNLMDQYLNKYHLYADNFYNSVNLVLTLLLKKIRLGTIKANRGILNSLKNVEKCATRYRSVQKIVIFTWSQLFTMQN